MLIVNWFKNKRGPIASPWWSLWNSCALGWSFFPGTESFSISTQTTAFCRYAKSKEAQNEISLPRKIHLQILLQEKEKNWTEYRKLPFPYCGKSQVCLKCPLLPIKYSICKNFVVLKDTAPAQNEATTKHASQESSLVHSVFSRKAEVLWSVLQPCSSPLIRNELPAPRDGDEKHL